MSKDHTPPTQAELRIYTRCPSCHNDTLTLNDGHLLCTWHECKDPTAIDTIWKYTPRDSVMERTGMDPIARLAKEVEELRKDKERLQRAVGFFSSVIKSGEPWTSTCEETLKAAMQKTKGEG